MHRHFDWLIVGAGFVGSVLAERLATQLGKRVLIIDQRNHIAGNAYDLRNEHGILYHQYGPHIFHTNSQQIFEYLSRFTGWRPYEHRVVGFIQDRLVPIPFNFSSLDILFPKNEAERLKALMVSEYGIDRKVPILKMKGSDHSGIRDLSQFIYENVFNGYTRKQWGLSPEELSPSVTARVPVNVSYDDRYFEDKFQFMPDKGYTAIFEKMLNHPNIMVETGVSFKDIGGSIAYDRVVYTGQIDEFFEYSLGALPYRSLEFNFQTYRQRHHQTTGTVNYPNSQAFTRITEMRHLTGEESDQTTVAVEYPREHIPGKTVPYYPIPRDENNQFYNRYAALAAREAKNVIFAGRLGDYKYYNMDQAVGRALSVFSDIAKG